MTRRRVYYSRTFYNKFIISSPRPPARNRIVSYLLVCESRLTPTTTIIIFWTRIRNYAFLVTNEQRCCLLRTCTYLLEILPISKLRFGQVFFFLAILRQTNYSIIFYLFFSYRWCDSSPVTKKYKSKGFGARRFNIYRSTLPLSPRINVGIDQVNGIIIILYHFENSTSHETVHNR